MMSSLTAEKSPWAPAAPKRLGWPDFLLLGTLLPIWVGMVVYLGLDPNREVWKSEDAYVYFTPEFLDSLVEP